MDPAVHAALGIVAAAVGGLAVGVERQWSGHASGAQARFAGLRTFTLLGGLAGISGWLWQTGQTLPAALLLAGGAALVIVAYAAVSRRDVEATTEVAALVVLAAGFLAGSGALALASGSIAMTVLLLVEKSRLHGWARRLNDAELRAAARFAVMAVVVLPLLPEGPFGPFGGVRPRQLWALVLLFAGIGFAGYIARRLVGAERGVPLAGLLGGLVSSTQVTLAHARASRAEPGLAVPLACGALAACTVLYVRTLAAAAVLDAGLARALAPSLLAPFLCGLAASLLTLRRSAAAGPQEAPKNPLQLRAALQMALLFQVVLLIAWGARQQFGAAGVFGTAALVGLTDVDAVTVSMARLIGDGLGAGDAARAVVLAIIANTLLKLGLAAVLGGGRFRLAVVAGLGAMTAALAFALF
ncbi:MAG: DUF4010 domain-containing protein [Deltaproteobacteria bacterium]|nr:DUF4010 domain-containing protein [Deltaproteobacteria bacterium]